MTDQRDEPTRIGAVSVGFTTQGLVRIEISHGAYSDMTSQMALLVSRMLSDAAETVADIEQEAEPHVD